MSLLDSLHTFCNKLNTVLMEQIVAMISDSKLNNWSPLSIIWCGEMTLNNEKTRIVLYKYILKTCISFSFLAVIAACGLVGYAQESINAIWNINRIWNTKNGKIFGRLQTKNCDLFAKFCLFLLHRCNRVYGFLIRRIYTILGWEEPTVLDQRQR